MSQELHIFLAKDELPDRNAWQEAVRALGLPFELDPTLNTLSDSGFSPSKIKDSSSGFEFYSEPRVEILTNYPGLEKAIGDRDWCITFRWGGDLNECACVMSAGAALAKVADVIAYSPEDDLTYDFAGILGLAKACL